MKATQKADLLLDADLGEFPLVDPKKFLISYTEHPERYEYDLGISYSNDSDFFARIESYIIENAYKIEDDDDFNIIHAKHEYDYYLKVLRRLISVDLYMDSVIECADEHVAAEMVTINKCISALQTTGEESAAFKKNMPVQKMALDNLKRYKQVLNNFYHQMLAFYQESLEDDLIDSNCYAKTRMYPVTIKLHECESSMTIHIN